MLNLDTLNIAEGKAMTTCIIYELNYYFLNTQSVISGPKSSSGHKVFEGNPLVFTRSDYNYCRLSDKMQWKTKQKLSEIFRTDCAIRMGYYAIT